jgi:uncharacterized membrane protein YgdD (TMEM256/DUF423 family)
VRGFFLSSFFKLQILLNKTIVITAAILICLAIITGAFGAHGLKKIVNQEGLVIFDKAVKYQMYMGLAFLAIGLAADKISFNLKWFFRLGLSGVIIFSGLLYILTFKELEPSLKICGAIVPIGGTLMIVSWVIFIVNLFKSKDS